MRGRGPTVTAAQSRLRFAAGPPARQGGRHRHRPHRRLGPARPRHRARRRGGERRAGPARAGRRAAPRRTARSRRRCRTSKSARSTRRAATIVPHDGMRRTIAQRLTASVQTIPHFYLTIDCDIGKLAGGARGDQRRGAEGQGRQAGLQALGQRLRHQGPGAGLAARAGRQRELDRSRHAQAQAFRHRRRGGAAGRPDHADRPQRRNEIAVGDLQRDEGAWRRGRARRKLKPQEYQGGTIVGVQSRHVRHQGLHRRDQSAAIDHPRGRRRRGTRGGARRQDRGRADHERDACRAITARSMARSAPS